LFIDIFRDGSKLSKRQGDIDIGYFRVSFTSLNNQKRKIYCKVITASIIMSYALYRVSFVLNMFILLTTPQFLRLCFLHQLLVIMFC